jgi:hypothetical protein
MSVALTITAANKAPRVIEVSSGDTVTLVKTDANVMIHAASTLAALTVILPPAIGLSPGKSVNIGFAVSVTALTLQSGAGNTFLISPPTGGVINTVARFTLDVLNRWCFI